MLVKGQHPNLGDNIHCYGHTIILRLQEIIATLTYLTAFGGLQLSKSFLQPACRLDKGGSLQAASASGSLYMLQKNCIPARELVKASCSYGASCRPMLANSLYVLALMTIPLAAAIVPPMPVDRKVPWLRLIVFQKSRNEGCGYLEISSFTAKNFSFKFSFEEDLTASRKPTQCHLDLFSSGYGRPYQYMRRDT